MWTISSNDVQQVKDRIDCRRSEIETRYAAEIKALDSESAAVEELERVAAEFALRHSRGDPDTPTPAAADAAPAEAFAEPTGQAEPIGQAEPTDEAEPTSEADPMGSAVDAEAAPPPAAEVDAAGYGEANLSFDILKPGSRWRLNRATRLLNPDGTPSTGSPT